MANMFVKLKQVKPRNYVLAAVLTCAVVLSAATAVMVPLVNEPKAAGEKPGTTEYYEARWEEAKTRFGKVEKGTAYTDYQGNTATTTVEGPWMVEDLQGKVERGELSAPWNGVAAGTAPTETVNGGAYDAATNPWKVYTAEEFRWCLTNFNSFQLQRDIDLAGYTGIQWATPGTSSTVWTADGNGHTIYNYYIDTTSNYTGLFGRQYDVAIRNLRICNSFVYTGSMSSAFLGGSGSTKRNTTLTNCTLEKSWVRGRGYGIAGIAANFKVRGIYQSYVKECVIYGTSHVASVTAYYGAQEVKNSFSANNVVISSGSHSGGFGSCIEGTFKIENCFTSNVDMYANTEAGNFYSRGSSGGDSFFTNCFSSGKMEGMADLGGFLAGDQTYPTTVTNCYTTTSTGIVEGGSNIGGFVGSYYPTWGGGQLHFENCYAAGEVGSIDTAVTPNRTTHTTVGGFVGQPLSNFSYTNCYYDKQTTGMREWESGKALDGGAGDIAGITGLLTTTTEKSGVGMTDPNWTALGEAYNNDLGEGYYPQLDVFTHPCTFSGFKGWTTDEEIQELVRACSVASVSTVQMDTWETDYAGNPLPETTYDTVRDVIGKFPMTSGSGSVGSREGLPTVDTSVDVALNKTVTYSSQYDGNTWKAANVVDGKPTTSWSSAAGTGVGEWVQVDLGKDTNVGKISVSLPSSKYIPMSYDVLVSTDEAQWETVGSFQDVGNEYRHVELPQGKQVRYVRVQTTKLTGAYSYISSIEVYPAQEYTTMPGYDYAIAQWERCGVTGQGTLNNGTGAQSYAFVMNEDDKMYDVIDLYQEGAIWYGDHPMPGIDWLQVTTAVGNSNGYRALRICPTVGLDAGLSCYVGTGSRYDHADDVRLAYSTGGRMAANNYDFTYGVYPDTPLNEYQKGTLNASAYQNITDLGALYAQEGQDDAFRNIDVLHMERTGTALDSGVPTPVTSAGAKLNDVVIYEVASEEEGGGTQVTREINLDDPAEAQRWNGKTVFAQDNTHRVYALEYTWSLADGRYIRDIKRVETPTPSHKVQVSVEYKDGRPLSDQAYLDAYSKVDEYGDYSPYVTPNFASAPISKDVLAAQPHGQPAAIAWKWTAIAGDLVNCEITFSANDQAETVKVDVKPEDMPQNPGESTQFQVTTPYKAYSYDRDGNMVWNEVQVTKTYFITLDENGVYEISFHNNYPDNANGVMVADVDFDIAVKLTVGDSTKPVPKEFMVQKTLDAVAEEKQHFYFKVEYCGAEAEPGPVQQTMYVRIDIEPGSRTGTAQVKDVAQGWYTVTELDSNGQYVLDGDKTVSSNPEGMVNAQQRSVTYWIGQK